MDRCVVELEPTDTGESSLFAPPLPGLLILGQSTDEVLDRARAAIHFHKREKQTGLARLKWYSHLSPRHCLMEDRALRSGP